MVSRLPAVRAASPGDLLRGPLLRYLCATGSAGPISHHPRCLPQGPCAGLFGQSQAFYGTNYESVLKRHHAHPKLVSDLCRALLRPCPASRGPRAHLPASKREVS